MEIEVTYRADGSLAAAFSLAFVPVDGAGTELLEWTAWLCAWGCRDGPFWEGVGDTSAQLLGNCSVAKNWQ